MSGLDPVDLTAKLVRCASVTPVNDGALEVLEEVLDAAGFDCTRVDRGGICNLFARWGNKGKRFQRRVKEKQATKKDLRPGDDRGGAQVNDAERMKLAFQKANETKKRSLREVVDCGRITLAWLFNIVFYLIMCWFTYTYAILFGPEETNGWLMSFVLASGNAWLIIEPFEVVLLVMLPFLFDNKCVANCRETAKELGLI